MPFQNRAYQDTTQHFGHAQFKVHCVYTQSGKGSPRKASKVFAALRFLWNATRGHRLAPWRSQYLRWRVETFSGMKAETITARDFWRFVWTDRWELLSFLVWTGRLERDVHAAVKSRAAAP